MINDDIIYTPKLPHLTEAMKDVHEHLLKEEELTKKNKPQYFTGDVICTRAVEGGTTRGKVYHIDNGVIEYDNGVKAGRIHSVQHLNQVDTAIYKDVNDDWR